MEYSVKVDAFEGPLDLLLHLINRFEIDIYDIPVATITEQYMMFIHTMNELQLDVASEYLVMKSNNYIQCLKQVSNFHLPVFFMKNVVN